MVAPAQNVDSTILRWALGLVGRSGKRSRASSDCGRRRGSGRGGTSDDGGCLRGADGGGRSLGGNSSAGELSDGLGSNVDERKSGAGNELNGVAVANVVDQGLVVRGDEDGDGAIDVGGDDALIERQGQGSGLATDHHLAEESLTRTQLRHRTKVGKT